MKKNIFIILIILLILIFNLEIVRAIEMEVKIPNAPKEISSFPKYLSYIFIFGLTIVGATALLMITYGAIRYIASASNPSMKGEAKDIINKALLGMGLLLISYLLLKTINPDLVNIRNPSIKLKNLENAAGETLPK